MMNQNYLQNIKKYIDEKYFISIQKHYHKRLYLIVHIFPYVLKRNNNLGLSGLMQAVASRNYSAITFLMDQGIDPNLMDKDGWSAKTWAVFMNDSKSLKILSSLSVLTHSRHNNIYGIALLRLGAKSSCKIV